MIVPEAELKDMVSDSNIHTSFISLYHGESEPIYLPIKDFDELNKVLTDKMEEYNETKA